MISAKSVEFYEQPGKLSKVPVDESKIPEEDRIPRITTSVWYISSFLFMILADKQEIQEWSRRKLYPRCRFAGHCLCL
jgi:hypothetical protein